MRSISIVAALVAGGCAHLPGGFVECNDTETCRAQARARDHAFAQAVAEEPLAKRLEVEPVTSLVLVDRNRQLVYALDPELVALELQTGRERWRVKGARGDRLWRVGEWLVVGAESARFAQLAFVDPTQVTPAALQCMPRLPAPEEATEFHLHPFDRAGEPFLFWRTSSPYRGGTPPSEEHEHRAQAAEACGVVQLDVPRCSAEPLALEDLLFDPPEGRRRSPGEHGFCGYFAPLRDLPAAAASAPQAPSDWALLTPVTRAPLVTVRARAPASGERCGATKVTLEVRNAGAELIWSHPLADLVDVCPVP